MKIDSNDPRLTAYALGEIDETERAVEVAPAHGADVVVERLLERAALDGLAAAGNQEDEPEGQRDAAEVGSDHAGIMHKGPGGAQGARRAAKRPLNSATASPAGSSTRANSWARARPRSR